ncbi:ankyrin [Cenococcum geophilum 1.58]|uniref:ankyrin n=1 Tax=Cenococcum geophilum 1.58 TaxID=794803 RepID=UPI00358F74EC|nr:ankyrin [Cenococcum geophilum 1.58]
MNNRGNDITPAAQGTCSWLLKHKAYLGWIYQGRGLLWVKGKPGAGKSTLLKYALQTCKRQEPSLPNKPTTLSFFFHGRGAKIQRNTLGFFRSLLYQLLERFPSPFSDVVQTFKDRRDKIGQPGDRWNWHPQELQDFLKASLPKVLEKCPILIMVDALDECGEKEAVRLVGCFQRLLSQCSSTKNGLSICFSCRHYPIVSLDNGFEVCVEHENHEDITKYIRDELQDTIQKDEELEVLKNEILDRSSYVFQWVVLVLPRALSQYRKGHSLPRIQQRLRDLPTELGGLYRDILQRLAEDDDERSQSLLLMQWIYFARRPLSLTELRFAMIAGHDIPYHSLHECQLSPDFAENDKQMEKRIKSLSGGLAEVKTHRNRPVAQFIHQSVNDYLIKEGLGILASSSDSEDKLIGHAHSRLSKSCIRYIAMEEIHQWLSKHEKSLKEYRSGRAEKPVPEKEFPLAEYATESWLPHAVAAEAKEVSQEDLLDSVGWPSARTTQDWACMFRLINQYHSKLPVTGTTFLHEASRHGITSAVKAILSRLNSSDINTVDADPKDKAGQTPLSWAAAGGDEAVVELLVATAGVDADSKGEDGRTPLSQAAQGGREAVVELLLATTGVDADSKDKDGRTPLSQAAQGGHEAVVKLLLATTGVDADSKDEDGRTPLSQAAQGGHEAVVKLLLATAGVDADSKDKDGRTPLSRAVQWGYGGHEAVVKLLLATAGVDADSKDEGGRTPLSWAAQWGRGAVVKLLVATVGVDAESKDKDSRTPLSWAADGECVGGLAPPQRTLIRGGEAVVKLLLATAGVDAYSKDEGGRTPLSWAAERGHEAVVKQLLATAGVDADSKDKDGRTPLLQAAKEGHEAVVKLLVATAGVDADSKDNQGRTPLSWAATGRHESGLPLPPRAPQGGYKAVVKLLVATAGVNADSKDEGGRTPLSWAAAGGREAAVKLLLATAGVSADSKDEDGRTPLSWAAERGHGAVVELLVETAGVDADSKDKDGQTPLSWAAAMGHEAVAAAMGHEAVVKLLVATAGVDADSKGKGGRTPLSWAAIIGHETVVKLLVATAGVDADSKNEGGRTPLSCAAAGGHEAVVKLLVATAGVDADSKDKDGRTPLSRAAAGGNEAVVKLLVAIAGAGVDVDSKDEDGRTPLSWAAQGGHEAVVRLLRSYNANS